MKERAGVRSMGRLLPLTLLVSLAHLALLRLPTDSLVLPGGDPVRTFSTRTVAPPPPAAPESPAAAAAPAAEAAAPTPQSPARPVVEAAAKPAEEPANRGAAETTVPEPAAAPPPPPPPAAASELPAVAVPAPARFRYEVTASRYGVSLQGQADLHWRHDGEQYEARLEVSSPLLPSRVERSVGRIGEAGLAPSYYAQKTRGEQAAHFEHDKGRITFSNNRPPAELVAGMQDRLSVVLQLAALIAGNPPRYPAGSEIVIPTTSTREAESWIFSVDGEEDLQLPGGALRALKLQRRPRKEFDQKVELWLAPRMDYAPVRLRLTNPNGDTVDQRWSSTDKG